MSICPFADWKPLPENDYQGSIVPTQLIIHTAVDQPGPTNLEKWFGRESVKAESHFWLTNNGKLVQMMDTNVRANANRYADVRAISIETEDDGNPEGNPWTPAQLDTLVRLIKWVKTAHDIPTSLIKTSTGAGIGWHSMFGFTDPIAQTGPLRNNPWSFSYAKTCPGKTRINQFLNDVLPTAQGNMDSQLPLLKGSTGLLVTILQYILNEFGAAGLEIDGQFGAATATAVRSYQGKLDVPVTGVWTTADQAAHSKLLKFLGSVAADSREVFEVELPLTSGSITEAIEALEKALGILKGV